MELERSTHWSLVTHICVTLQWRHNGRDSVSNHQPYHCIVYCLFRRRSEKTSKLRVTGLCAGNSPVTGEFPAQMASYAENASIWWRHHEWTGPLFFHAMTFRLAEPSHYLIPYWLIVIWTLRNKLKGKLKTKYDHFTFQKGYLNILSKNTLAILFRLQCVKSSRPSDACIWLVTKPSLVQIVVCRMFGTKPMKFESKYIQNNAWVNANTAFCHEKVIRQRFSRVLSENRCYISPREWQKVVIDANSYIIHVLSSLHASQWKRREYFSMINEW